MRPDAADTAARFDAWAARLELTATLAKLRGVVLPWVARCAPEGTSADDHCLAAADLALFIFYLDDLDGPDEPLRFADAERILAGEIPSPDASPLCHGWRDLLAQVSTRGLSIERYLTDRQTALAAWRTRNAARRSGVTWRLEDWLTLRSTTIFMRQWMSLWELLTGRVVSDAMRARPAFERAVRATCRWQVLANEVASVDRDRATGETNAVFLEMRERGVSEHEAVTRVMAMASAARRDFDHAARALLDDTDDVALQSYVHGLRVSIEGAVEHYADRHARYARIQGEVQRSPASPLEQVLSV